jgi:UDP-glucose 4-epimerase
MRKFYNNSKIKFYIGDVRARQSLDAVMTGVDYVFHAAALKQVPSCEFFPIEAVRTNVLGAENVLDSAIQHGVKKAVILSTDKAVYPLNAMGMSKAMMEKVMIARSRNIQNGGSLVCGTRYGNVMASRGSVIPLFVHQIHEGKPLTLTDPTMTRFMMSLENAVELVVFAFENANQGDIFVQKAPACTIETLAKALLELYHANNEIKVIGIRHGEKVYETLVAKEDMLKAEDLGDYYRIPADTRDLNYDLYFVSGKFKIREAQEYTSHNTKQLNVEETKKLLLQLQFIRDDLGLQ